MKKYTKANFKMIFCCIILPIILFFIAMSSCYAYFTAQSRNMENNNSTAILQISFSEDEQISINTQILASDQKILPGDNMQIMGKLENKGSADAYCIIVLGIDVYKESSDQTSYNYKKAFSLSGGEFVEISGTENNYSVQAFSLESANPEKTNTYSVDFSLPFTFDGTTFDNEYENATIKYYLTAHAIQKDNLEGGLTSATNILMKGI